MLSIFVYENFHEFLYISATIYNIHNELMKKLWYTYVYVFLELSDAIFVHFLFIKSRKMTFFQIFSLFIRSEKVMISFFWSQIFTFFDNYVRFINLVIKSRVTVGSLKKASWIGNIDNLWLHDWSVKLKADTLYKMWDFAVLVSLAENTGFHS